MFPLISHRPGLATELIPPPSALTANQRRAALARDGLPRRLLLDCHPSALIHPRLAGFPPASVPDAVSLPCRLPGSPAMAHPVPRDERGCVRSYIWPAGLWRDAGRHHSGCCAGWPRSISHLSINERRRCARRRLAHRDSLTPLAPLVPWAAPPLATARHGRLDPAFPRRWRGATCERRGRSNDGDGPSTVMVNSPATSTAGSVARFHKRKLPIKNSRQ
jgi:hypothetical protein